MLDEGEARTALLRVIEHVVKRERELEVVRATATKLVASGKLARLMGREREDPAYVHARKAELVPRGRVEQFIKYPRVVFDRLALYPLGARLGVESVEHRGAIKGDPVGADPRAAPIFGTVEKGSEEVANDHARLVGNPSLASGVAQGSCEMFVRKPGAEQCGAP